MSAVLSSFTAPAGDAPGSKQAQPEFVIVMNRGSGSAAKDEAHDAIVSELQAAGRAHRFVPIAEGGIVQACQHAARLVAEQGGVLVAAGGDGTLNCAAQAAVMHDCPMGIIAQGTFNLFARQLGLPLAAAEATRMLLRATAEPVQVGWINQRVFLVNASVGLYPQLLADREEVKQKLGRRRSIAMLAALKSMLEWRHRLVLDAEVDGVLTQLRTATVFVCNNALQLRRVGIAEEIVEQIGHGRLGCLSVRTTDLWSKLRVLAAAAFGQLGRDAEIDSIALRSLTVGGRGARRVKVATDGEIQWMELPLHFTVAPRPLRVMLPPAELRLPPR
jgi:diacylglycerol kinase family enzyme